MEKVWWNKGYYPVVEVQHLSTPHMKIVHPLKKGQNKNTINIELNGNLDQTFPKGKGVTKIEVIKLPNSKYHKIIATVKKKKVNYEKGSEITS